MSLTTIRTSMRTNPNVTRARAHTHTQTERYFPGSFAPTFSLLDNCAVGVAGLGLLHPRTTQSQVYDVLQMVGLWYIIAMVPVGP